MTTDPGRDGGDRAADRADDRRRRPHGWQFSRLAIAAREITARLFGPVFAWFLEGPTVTGAEHLAAVGPGTIICPTHASHLDSSAMRLALGPRHRRRLAAAVAADYFTVSRKRWFFAAWIGAAFPLDRSGHGGHDSFAVAECLLADGWDILLDPEGTRSVTGEIGRFPAGIGLLAIRTGCPVLPARIVGIAAVLPKGARWPHRGPVEVRFGMPMRALPGEDARAFTARLEDVIRAL
jgi:1-acyl-sn-glycerol-3-phosphate acyltransferase